MKAKKKPNPTVYVMRDKYVYASQVLVPVTEAGWWIEHQTNSVCYKRFEELTGLALRKGEIKKVRFTAKEVK